MAVPGKKAAAKTKLSSSTCSMGSEEDLEIYCQPCDREGLRLPPHGYCTNCAEHLCEPCFTVHKRHKMSRHHTLLDKASMPKTIPHVASSKSDNLIKPCPKHNIEMIKFYCHDHEALLCNVCVTLGHSPASCKVNYIPDISGHVINSREYQNVLKEINDMTYEASKLLQDMKQMFVKSNKSLTNALTDIKKLRTKMNQRLDDLEKQVTEDAKDMLKENSKHLISVEKECGDITKSSKSTSDAIAHLNTSNQANELFMELKLAEQMIKDNERNLAKLTAFDVKEYNVYPNEAISNLLDKEKSIGTLKGNVSLKYRKISHISVETSKDKEPCIIQGMTLCRPNLLVITDRGNNAVKMVDTSQKSVLSQRELDSEPWDVSSVSDDEIVVTIPDIQILQFMSVSSDSLMKKQIIEVDGKCYGISCHKDNMVVSFTCPPKVKIININGTVLQTIQQDSSFENPRYITTSEDYIYVSDFNISKLNWQGELRSKHVCKSEPYGLTMSNDGSIFVCYNDNTITELSVDFTKEQTIVKDIQDPRAVYWSAESCTLYTTSCSSDTENDKFIKIFKSLR